MVNSRKTNLKVAIGGLGVIGKVIAKHLDDGMEGLELAAVSARRKEVAELFLAGLHNKVPIVPLAQLADYADIVVECAPSSCFSEIADSAVAKGCILVPASVGQLISRMDLVDKARESGGRIVVPTGALLGLDAIRAAAQGNIKEVRMITQKPPRGLVGAPYIVANNISLEGLKKPLKIFEGSAREAIKGFPANVNVAVALALAGKGPDKTLIEIWADPTKVRNTHHIKVDSDSAILNMTIENIPTEENPKTGKITALSLIAAIEGLNAILKIGS